MTRHGHASGRYNAPPSRAALDIAQIIKAHDLDAFTLTEYKRPRSWKALRFAVHTRLPGYRFQRVGEYVCITRRAVYEPRGRPWAFLATPVVSMLMGRMVARNRVGIFPLRDAETNRPVRFLVCHMPSGVDGGGKYKRRARPGKVRSHTTGLKGVRRALDRWEQRHPYGIQYLQGDFNVNLNSGWRYSLSVELNADPISNDGEGTLGSRRIDAGFTRGPTVTSEGRTLERKPAGFDHRPFTYEAEPKGEKR